MMGCSSVSLPPPPPHIYIPQPGIRVKQRNEQAKESKSISQLHSKMPIVFDFDFDTSLARDSSVHCLRFRVSSDHLLLLLLLPLSLLYTAAIVVWPPSGALNRGLRHRVCECERAVDRTTTIEVIVSEILGFFSKQSDQRKAEESRGLDSRGDWPGLTLC